MKKRQSLSSKKETTTNKRTKPTTISSSSASSSSSPSSSSGTYLKHNNKLVIVTGGANGIGRAISLEFVKEGAHVACCDLDANAGAETVGLAKAITDINGQLIFIQADFSKADLTSYVKKATEWQKKLGFAPRVDILVNNVGIQIDNGKPAHLLPDNIWDLVMNVNLRSHFLMSKLCIPGMLEAGKGVIINISSVQASQSQVGIPAYAASKGGINSLTRQMACDYSTQGIRVLSVSPGSVATPLVRRLMEEDGNTVEELGKMCPRGVMGEPVDIANTVLFLSSDKAANFTGTDVTCDGGLMAMGSWDHRVGFTSYLK